MQTAWRTLFIFILCAPSIAAAQSFGSSPVAQAVPITGPRVAYGDIIDYDPAHGIYVLSQAWDDPHVFGIATKDAAVVLLANSTDVPVTRAGLVLVNVTLENGPIRAGDAIVASSVAGKGMKARTGDTHVIGEAREAFDGSASSTREYAIAGGVWKGGTIIVALKAGLGAGSADGAASSTAAAKTGGAEEQTCIPRIGCLPFAVLLRYIAAAVIATFGLTVAWRTFMSASIAGVVSIGRNPRARIAIEGAVLANAVLAGVVALAALGSAVAVLYIHSPLL